MMEFASGVTSTVSLTLNIANWNMCTTHLLDANLCQFLKCRSLTFECDFHMNLAYVPNISMKFDVIQFSGSGVITSTNFLTCRSLTQLWPWTWLMYVTHILSVLKISVSSSSVTVKTLNVTRHTDGYGSFPNHFLTFLRSYFLSLKNLCTFLVSVKANFPENSIVNIR